MPYDLNGKWYETSREANMVEDSQIAEINRRIAEKERDEYERDLFRVMEERDHLQEENRRLREELEERLKEEKSDGGG